MDYKELIDELVHLSEDMPLYMQDDNGRDCAWKSADAIETLMAERDAAIKILRETNWCAGCIHFKGLKGCANNAMSLCCDGNDHYQFCAPGKGDKSDG